MNEANQHDEKWRAILGMAAPAYAVEAELPYGLVTKTLARVRAQRMEQQTMERTGLRALFAALAILAVAGGITFGLKHHHGPYMDPGINSIIEEDNVSIS